MARYATLLVLLVALLAMGMGTAAADDHLYPPVDEGVAGVVVERPAPQVVAVPAVPAQAVRPQLAVTGGDGVALAGAALGLMVLGGGLVLASRRRVAIS